MQLNRSSWSIHLATTRRSFASQNIGIVGLPNVGKSTIWNSLTKTQLAQASNFPFTTIEPNKAFVAVPDPRLETLAKIAKSNKIIPSRIEFVDVAGLVKGAHKGQGLGNKFLANIREVSVVLHVLRCFDDPNIVHVDTTVDPVRDLQVVETELILADLQSIEKRQAAKKKADRSQAELLDKCAAVLTDGQLLFAAPWTPAEWSELQKLQLLTTKPVAYVCNTDEAGASSGAEGGNQHTRAVWDYVRSLNEKREAQLAEVRASAGAGTPKATLQMGWAWRAVRFCAQIEDQASQIAAKEGAEASREFLELADVSSTSLEQVIGVAADFLNLHHFYTVGPEEARSWDIRKGATAVEAATEIHTDIAKGFIKAEVISYQDYVDCSGEAQAKATGKLRLEGKDYIVADGDVMHFRHKS